MPGTVEHLCFARGAMPLAHRHTKGRAGGREKRNQSGEAATHQVVVGVVCTVSVYVVLHPPSRLWPRLVWLLLLRGLLHCLTVEMPCNRCVGPLLLQLPGLVILGVRVRVRTCSKSRDPSH